MYEDYILRLHTSLVMFILNGSANAEVDNVGIFGEFVKTPIETIAYEKIVEFS